METNRKQAGKRLFSPCCRGRRCVVLIVIALLWLAATAVSADEGPTLYLAGGEDPSLQELVRARVRAHFGDQVRFRAYDQDTGPDELVIALDASTLAEVRANNNDQPIIALFSTRDAIRKAVGNDSNFSAIYSDPPLLRQAKLGQLIIPRASHVAILASPQKAGDYEELLDAIREQEGLYARVFVVSSQKTLTRDLNRALAYGDFILGTPDNRIFNRNTVKPLLLTSYRRNRLVIGPSRPFVRAGAVASTYTPAGEQVDEAVSLIKAWFSERALPEPRYPWDFRVAINHQVANSMNIPLPDAEALRESLKTREAEE